jgi:peroxiredoxin
VKRPRLLQFEIIVVCSVICFLIGLGWLVRPAFHEKIEIGASKFADEPSAHELYDQMIEAMQKAKSLSYVSHYEREATGRFKTCCTYRVWLKKPNYFRMETQATSGEQGGVLIGDGSTLWIYWPNGRPRWEYVNESEGDEKTRFNSYKTKPAPQGQHSLWHEAIFLGAGMSFPILEASTFHGYVDSIEGHLDGVRGIGTETIGGEECDQIEVSLMDHQRSWYLWLSKQDHLPRQLKEITRVSYEVATHEKWSAVSIDDDIPETMFAWAPPANWQEWKLPDDEDSLLKPGSTAPDFDMASADEKRIRLSDYLGKSVWLYFWRVGCPPCQKEMPYLQDLYRKCQDKGLVVLGVNVWDDRQITLDYLRNQGVTFPNIFDTSEAAQTICVRDYGGGTVPQNYLIDGDGIIVDAWFGHSEGHAREKAALEKIGLGLADSVP